MTSLSAATEHQLSILNQKHLQLLKLQQQKQKLEQKLAETSNKGVSTVYNNPELFPLTPKNTPFFMTPPVTPPNESYHNIYIGGLGPADPGKPPTNKDKVSGLLNNNFSILMICYEKCKCCSQNIIAQNLSLNRNNQGNNSR